MKTTISVILILCGVFLVSQKLTEIKPPPISKYEAVNPAWQDPRVYEKQHDVDLLKVEVRQLIIKQDQAHNEFKIPD
tara:strand:- start:769 stop:999 length:231 start_codon:yes stop_codon:yes gene_type:complete